MIHDPRPVTVTEEH